MTQVHQSVVSQKVPRIISTLSVVEVKIVIKDIYIRRVANNRRNYS